MQFMSSYRIEFLSILIFVILILLPLVGCKTFSRSVSKISGANEAKISQAVGEQNPASVETADTSTELPLPEGSEISVNPQDPEKVFVKLKRASLLKVKTLTQRLEGPKSFAPPSPTEKAKGTAVLWSFIAGGIFLVGGIALIYFQHYKEGGIALVASFVVPVVAQFLTSDLALKLCIAFACISVSLTVAYYLISRKHDIFPKSKR